MPGRAARSRVIDYSSTFFHEASHAIRAGKPMVPPLSALVTPTTSSATARGRHPHNTKSATPQSSACAGSLLVPVRANGVLAFGQYKPDPEHGGFVPWALQVHEVVGGKISRMTFFLDAERLFPLFGLQDKLFDDR